MPEHATGRARAVGTAAARIRLPDAYHRRCHTNTLASAMRSGTFERAVALLELLQHVYLPDFACKYVEAIDRVYRTDSRQVCKDASQYK